MAKEIKYLPQYYKSYVNLVPEEDVLQALMGNYSRINTFFSQIPEQSGDYRYADNKWTVKQLIGHINDAERIFAYRALRFARNDQTALSGFEENTYVPESNASNRSVKQLSDEFKNIRLSTIDLFKSFNEEMLGRYGEANNKKIDVRSIGFVIAGHVNHHYNILKDKYQL